MEEQTTTVGSMISFVIMTHTHTHMHRETLRNYNQIYVSIKYNNKFSVGKIQFEFPSLNLDFGCCVRQSIQFYERMLRKIFALLRLRLRLLLTVQRMPTNYLQQPTNKCNKCLVYIVYSVHVEQGQQYIKQNI